MRKINVVLGTKTRFETTVKMHVFMSTSNLYYYSVPHVYNSCLAKLSNTQTRNIFHSYVLSYSYASYAFFGNEVIYWYS